MKLFIIKLLTYSAIFVFIVGIFFIPLVYQYSDDHYGKVTSPQSCYLIIGTSRAGQGMKPDIFDSVLFSPNSRKFINFAFNFGISPYGSVYLNAIKRKIKPGCQNSIFILAVDPFSISTDGRYKVHGKYSEENRFLNEISQVATKPNIEYLMSKSNPFNSLFKGFISPHPIVKGHENGWVEVSDKMDSISINNRTKEVISRFANKQSKFFSHSAFREIQLGKTIEFLKQFGSVYLVRLPVGNEMLEVENDFMPSFNAKMVSLTSLYKVKYFDLSKMNDEIDFLDGHHIYKTSSEKVSEIIAIKIKLELDKRVK